MVLPIYVDIKIKPKNSVFIISSIYFSFYPICNVECDEFLVMNVVIFVLPKFRTKLLAASNLTV
jgi:hypothetical protein